MKSTSIVSQAPEIDQAAVEVFCERARALHAKYGSPIEEGDPRIDELRAHRMFPVVGGEFTAEELGDWYFRSSDLVGEMPAWPLPTPPWAVSSTMSIMNYPQVTVEHDAALTQAGNAVAQLSRFDAIYVDAADGYPAGHVQIGHDEIVTRDANYTIEDANNLAYVIVRATQQPLEFSIAESAPMFRGEMPAWAAEADSDVEDAINEDNNPVATWVNKLVDERHFQAVVMRSDEYDIVKDVTVEGDVELALGIDRNAMISFSNPDHVREAAQKMLTAADEFESIVKAVS